MATSEGESQRPYRPNPIHASYHWMDRLPIPDWLFIFLLFPAIGIAQHLVAWNRGLLSTGDFNYDLGTAALYLVPAFLIGVHVLKGPTKALDEYRPLLDVSAQEYADLKYRFVTIPSASGALFFLVGAAMGLPQGFPIWPSHQPSTTRSRK